MYGGIRRNPSNYCESSQLSATLRNALQISSLVVNSWWNRILRLILDSADLVRQAGGHRFEPCIAHFLIGLMIGLVTGAGNWIALAGTEFGTD